MQIIQVQLSSGTLKESVTSKESIPYYWSLREAVKEVLKRHCSKLSKHTIAQLRWFCLCSLVLRMKEMVTRWILLSRLEETFSLQSDSVPWAITSLRVVALPLLIHSFSQEIKVATYALFLFAVCTDFLDGYLAKKLELTSRLGSYFDVTADFLFVSGMFLVFVLEGFYSPWILFLVVFVFVQFMLTSLYSRQTFY